MSPNRRPSWAVRGTALVLLVMACGKPEVRHLERYTSTVEANRVEVDAHGEEQVVLVLRRDDCPSDRRQLTVWAKSPGGAGACLRQLPVGKSVEVVDVIFKFPLMSCGGHDGPRNTIGGCTKDSVSFQQLGTACPRPAPP